MAVGAYVALLPRLRGRRRVRSYPRPVCGLLAIPWEPGGTRIDATKGGAVYGDAYPHEGWDWLWMSFMMGFWVILLGAVVYFAVRLAQRDPEHRTRP